MLDILCFIFLLCWAQHDFVCACKTLSRHFVHCSFALNNICDVCRERSKQWRRFADVKLRSKTLPKWQLARPTEFSQIYFISAFYSCVFVCSHQQITILTLQFFAYLIDTFSSVNSPKTEFNRFEQKLRLCNVYNNSNDDVRWSV